MVEGTSSFIMNVRDFIVVRILVTITLLLCSVPLLASGWVIIEGRNSLGEDIAWDWEDWRKASTEGETHHYVWATVEVHVKGRLKEMFQRQSCETTSYPEITLACDATGTSPLAGTKYLGKRVKGSCEKGDPAVRYQCKKGCGKNPRAPQVLKEGYWEC